MKKTGKVRLSARDIRDMEMQLARYPHECGPVTTYKVDPAVLKQEPVASLKVGALNVSHA